MYVDKMTRMEKVTEFWARAIPDGTGCFIWSGYKTPRGYGWVRLAGRNLRAHRAAYEIAIGPIPKGLCIDHLCRNPSCVNPLHLEAVTWRTNTLRGISPVAYHAAATHCQRGHPYAGENLYVSPKGFRGCRACIRISDKKSKLLRRSKPPGASDEL